jgi:hypothetical protein
MLDLCQNLSMILRSGEAFPPDWSMFVPELIVAIVTGLAIGFALWKVQVAGERRVERKQISIRWDVLKPALLGALRTHHRGVTRDSFRTSGEALRTVMKPFDQVPFGEWAETVPDERFSLVQDLQRISHELLHEGDDLERSLRGAAMMAGMSPDGTGSLAFGYLRELSTGTEPEHLIRLGEIGKHAAGFAEATWEKIPHRDNLRAQGIQYEAMLKSSVDLNAKIVAAFSAEPASRRRK